MNKVKVRCSVCGKPFKTPSAKKTVCPACDALAKRAKHQTPAAAAPQPATTVGPGVDVRAVLRAAQENQGQFGAYRPAPPSAIEAPTLVAKASSMPEAPISRNTGLVAPSRPPRGVGKPRAARDESKKPAPRPVKERKPRVLTKPFEPDAEQIASIRARYLELAQPEFDGIRHQIATELGFPLRAVKAVIKDLRTEQLIPSWWDRGSNLPTPEQIEQIRAIYMPLLPNPELGVHKGIAAQLSLSNTSVYQAIGQIRGELELPRYTPRDEESVQGVAADGQEGESERLPLRAAAGE